MRKSIVCAGCALLLALLSRYAADCADAVRAALSLCLTSVLPSLFPFFAVSSLSVSCGLAQALERPLAPLMRRCFHLPGCGAAALVLGFLGGYPAGARLSAELYRGGLCSREEASALAACCNNTGPAFLVGMCGAGLFQSTRAGLFLYAVHIGSALLTARLLRPPRARTVSGAAQPVTPPPFSRCLVQAVTAAGRACLMISAFLLFFSVVLCLLRRVGLLDALCALLAPVLPALGLSPAGMRSLLTGCLELTQGLAGLRAAAGTRRARLTAVSFLCAFGGLSVLFQTAAAADGLALSRCVRGKCVHACLAALLCALLLRLPVFSQI